MKTIHLTLAILFLGIALHAQKAEVLYFKANLPCCQARACNTLETDIKNVISTQYNDKDVVFKTIRIADEENAELVKKYNAKSQTVVIINNSKKKNNITDASNIVRSYARSNDKDLFEKDFALKLKESLK
jgi:hypothetical protein